MLEIKQNVFVPAIFSYSGEMHKRIKRLFLEQIGLKLQLVDRKKIKGSINHETLRSSNFHSNQQINKQKYIPQSYQNGQFRTPYAISNKKTLPPPTLATPPHPLLLTPLLLFLFGELYLTTYSKISNHK